MGRLAWMMGALACVTMGCGAGASGPVATKAGRVAGVDLPAGVRAYLGVPYARPPLRDLRWRAPRPIHWRGVFYADRKAPECVQSLRPHDINHYFGDEVVSEDCLYLNIWAPARGRGLPVIVYLHGGGGKVGSGAYALYDGQAVARHGAILVTLNYRLGLLGFLSHPALSREQGGHSGNYGFLDQNAALRWVRDNIAAFGGDPSKILLAGQSFGAESVSAHMASPMSAGLFRAAAMWSACSFEGNFPLPFGKPIVPLDQAERFGEEVQARMGAATLDAMRALPADRILAMQDGLANGRAITAPPTIDGLFWVEHKRDALIRNRFAHVPIMVGSNGDDMDSNRHPLVGTHTVADYRAMAQRMYGPDADAFLALYPVNQDADVQPMAHRAAVEGGFLSASQACAASTRSPAYVELFQRKHAYAPGVAIADQDVGTIGAYHTGDVPFWLGTLDAFNLFRTTRAWGAGDRAMSGMMVQALIAMARTGSPSTRALPWPAWRADRQRYVEFGQNARVADMATGRMAWQAAHQAAAVDAPVRRSPATRD